MTPWRTYLTKDELKEVTTLEKQLASTPYGDTLKRYTLNGTLGRIRNRCMQRRRYKPRTSQKKER